jgi:CRP-like cAMP-binding protein
MVSHQIVNLHYPTEVHAMRIRVGVEYKNPPNVVKDALYQATSTAKGVLTEPKTKIFLVDFGESACIYEIKFYMGHHSRINEINDAVRTNVWYELNRRGITIPFPIRTLQVQRKAGVPAQEEQAEALSILRGERLFECLSEEQLGRVVRDARLKLFGRGEPVIEEGSAGDSMFVMLRGAANVFVSKNGSKIHVATLGAGDCFGEMSLLTGEPRSATVRADADCYVMEIGKPVMAEVLRDAPDCLEKLSELLAQRKLETEGVLKEAGRAGEHALKERQYTATFLQRLRTFFQL